MAFLFDPEDAPFDPLSFLTMMSTTRHIPHLPLPNKPTVLAGAGVQDAYWSDDEDVSRVFLNCLFSSCFFLGRCRVSTLSRGDGCRRDGFQALSVWLSGLLNMSVLSTCSLFHPDLHVLLSPYQIQPQWSLPCLQT